MLNTDDRAAAMRTSDAAGFAADPDDGLARKAQGGDLSAFEELVRHHEAGLFHFILRMTGDHSSAEELAQATFVRAWEKLGSFEHRARFKTWLFRIAHHLCINRLTRNRPTEELPADFAGSPAQEPAEVLRQRQLEQVVRAALNQLPPDQRTCLILATWENMSYGDIAQSIGKSVRAVDSLLVRARQNLRRALEPARRQGLI